MLDLISVGYGRLRVGRAFRAPDRSEHPDRYLSRWSHWRIAPRPPALLTSVPASEAFARLVIVSLDCAMSFRALSRQVVGYIGSFVMAFSYQVKGAVNFRLGNTVFRKPRALSSIT